MKMQWFKMILILFLLCFLAKHSHATSFSHPVWNDDTVVDKTFGINFLLEAENIVEGFRFSYFTELLPSVEDDLLLDTLSLKAYSIGTGRLAMQKGFNRMFKHRFRNRFGCDFPADSDIPANPVPEPATMLLFGTGAIVVGTVVKRKKTK